MKRLTPLTRRQPFGKLGHMLAALATVAAVTGIALTGCNRTPSTIKIGVAQPLSGNIAAMGQDLLHGVTMGVDEINAQGGLRIGRHKVHLEVVSADDRSDAGGAKKTAQQLVDAGVVAAVADLNSGVSMAAAPVYAAAGVPQLAISTHPDYTRLGYPTTLRLVANDDQQSRAMAEFALQLGAKQYAVVDDGTPFGKNLADAVSRLIERGGKPVAVRRSLDDRTVSFEPLVAEMRERHVDVTLTTLADFQAQALMKQMASHGLSDMQLIGADNMKTTRLLGDGKLIRHVFATTPIVDAREFPRGPLFLANFRARFGAEPVYGAHYAYDAVYLVADAIERQGSVDRIDLLKELKHLDSYGRVTGSMRFEPDGEQRYGMVAVYQLDKGAWALRMRSDQW